MSKYLTLIATAGVLLAVAPAAAQQAEYPNRPIKIIVCLPPGGGVDTVTRLVADRLQRRLGQPIIIENKGGQSGNIGAEAVFAAEPDGYTLLASQPAPITTNPLLYKTISFDPSRFTPIAVMTTIPNTVTVRADLPAKNVQEFIAYAKSNPGKVSYASQGNGTTSHLTAVMFEQCGRVLQRTRDIDGIAQSRQSQNSRGDDVDAYSGTARCPNLAGSRAHRFRVRYLERHFGAAKDAGADRRKAQCRPQRGAEGA